MNLGMKHSYKQKIAKVNFNKGKYSYNDFVEKKEKKKKINMA